MARRRFRRKDLKRPDEFVSRGTEFLQWAAANGRLLAQIGGGVALVALIGVGFVSVRSARLRQANDDLDRALTQFRNSQYAQAATELADVANRWGSTTAGQVARLYAANADLRSANFDAAAALLQEVIGARDWPPYLQQQALLDLAFALERKPDVTAAAARYADAAALEGPYTGLAILGEARCREQAGERDKARSLYERFVREFPEAPETELASAKAAALKG